MQLEVLFLLDILFPPRADRDEVEIVDINPAIERTLDGYLDVGDWALKADLAGRSPWRAESGTLVGSGKFVVRHRFQGQQHISPKPWVIRMVETFEAFRMIGWDTGDWVIISGKDVGSRQMHMYLNLAGNAFTAFHYLPFVCSMLSTFRRSLLTAQHRRAMLNQGLFSADEVEGFQSESEQDDDGSCD